MHLSGLRWFGTASLTATLLLTACGGGSSTTEPDGTAPDGAATEPATDAAAEKIDFQAVRSRGKTAMFVPAPTEFQAALKATGTSLDITKLAQRSTRQLEGKASQIQALETGVRVADLLLAAQTGSKSAVVDRAFAAHEGLRAIGVAPAVLSKVDQVISDVNKGVLPIDKLGPVLDLLSRDIQADLDKKGAETSTLVQAGGWVEGVNLLSGAMGGAEHNADAAALLHQPAVLDHFLGFLKDSTAAKAQDEAVLGVIAEMEKMSELAKKDTLDAADVKSLNTSATAILARF